LPLDDRQFFTPMGGIPEDRAAYSRQRQTSKDSLLSKIVRRKQVSLDLLSPEAAFFGIPEGIEEETDEVEVLPKLIFPLRFPKKMKKSAHEHDDIEQISKQAHTPKIVRATRKDMIKTLILAALMTAFVLVCVLWKTHEDESHSLFGIVGTACVTGSHCADESFFVGHGDHFHKGDVSIFLFYSKHQLSYKDRFSQFYVIISCRRL